MSHSVLIVDDNPLMSRPLQKLLEYIGVAAHCVDGGEEALNSLSHHVPELVILDLMMPGLNGFDVLRRIRSECRIASLPVVVLSGVSEPEDVAQALALGANDFWHKGSIEYAKLRELVSPYLKSSPDHSPPRNLKAA